MPRMLFTLFFVLLSVSLVSQPKLILRLDDVGMNHSVNEAIAAFAETGIPFSTSVMFACPWYQEAVEILNSNPQISVGVHLTLNSEWKYYHWGPVLGQESVPSLVDNFGYFHPSTAAFLESDYDLKEVERELEAQIQRALASGLQIDYMDYHMRTALATPELKAVTDKLAEKYGLRRSMQMGENYISLFDVPVQDKKNRMMDLLTSQLHNEQINVIIIHVAKKNPEMMALIDMNNPTQNLEENGVASHREAELNMLLSKEVQSYLKSSGVEVINYGSPLD